MKLIVGLGNPGEKYQETRHNIGFIFADKLRTNCDFPAFTLNKKMKAEISQGSYGDEKIILAKPQTFMNLSGDSVQKILMFFKLTPKDVLILHDDKDILCGKYKLATNSSSAGHNGVQSIIDILGTKEFKRMRIGVKNENEDASASSSIETIDFVLGKLSKEELEKIKKIEKEILQTILL